MVEKRSSSGNGRFEADHNRNHKKARKSFEQKHQSHQPKDIFDVYTETPKQLDKNHQQSGNANIQVTSAATPLDRVALFIQLSYELDHDPAFFQEFRKVAGEGSSDALVLAKHVNSQKGILAALARQLPNIPHEPTEPRPCPTVSAWFDQYPDHLPSLPPILDVKVETKVFTAASYLAPSERTHLDSYERLEWLGDAYLELITRRIVFNILTDTSEALSATITQDFVRNENLARYALAYGFDERLRTSANHLVQTFGHAKKSMTKVYGDIFEAYVAGIIESDPVAGYKTAYTWIATLIKPTILKYTSVVPILPRAKEELARKLLGRGIKIDWEEDKPPTAVKGGNVFYYSAFLTGWGYTRQFLGSGQGPSKAQAQTLAAMEALTNPTTAVICAIKKEYDALVKAERQKEDGPDPAVLAALDKKYKEIVVE